VKGVRHHHIQQLASGVKNNATIEVETDNFMGVKTSNHQSWERLASTDLKSHHIRF